ncbi:MAG TPA: hypothetical protein VLN59_17200 [Burkholderiales bacterium]|nr:hypothetical protein [Burkholderiales bacterium]
MNNHGTIFFRGHSGERYCFQVWPVGTRFKPVPAVCIFSKRSYDNPNFAHSASHRCIRIGQTDDLARFAAANYDAMEKSEADCICVCIVTEPERRALMERDLLDANAAWDFVRPAYHAAPAAD